VIDQTTASLKMDNHAPIDQTTRKLSENTLTVYRQASAAIASLLSEVWTQQKSATTAARSRIAAAHGLHGT